MSGLRWLISIHEYLPPPWFDFRKEEDHQIQGCQGLPRSLVSRIKHRKDARIFLELSRSSTSSSFWNYWAFKTSTWLCFNCYLHISWWWLYQLGEHKDKWKKLAYRRKARFECHAWPRDCSNNVKQSFNICYKGSFE